MNVGFWFVALVQLVAVCMFGYLGYELIMLLRDIFVTK